MVDNRGPQLAGVVIAMVSLAVVTMSLRVYVRVWIRAWGLDDWFMLSAVVSLRDLDAIAGVQRLSTGPGLTD
jgi:hypothetical protein